MKKRRNPTKAEREAMESFAALQRKWDSMPKFSKGGVGRAVKASAIPKLTTPPGRETPRHPSLVTTGQGGGTKPIHGKRYTGTAMLGVATMHKSNAVPVFTDEDAKALAQMRRN